MAGHWTKVVANDTAEGVNKASVEPGEGIKDATGKQAPSKLS
jgi:hypothetical protein